MATLNELAYNVLNIARGGLSSDDDRLNIRQIKFWIGYYRALAIKESLTPVSRYLKPSGVDAQLVQDLGTLELEDVDAADSQVININCRLKRVRIPKIIDLPNGKGIAFVGSVDKQEPFILSEPNVVALKSHQRFTGKMRRCFFIGSYLYVTEGFNEDLRYINVRAIFSDPMEIKYTHADGTIESITDDSEYPLSENMIPFIVSNIMAKELNMTIQAVNDENNDSREPNTPVDDRTQIQ
jgi:hypothetical protein